MLGFIYFQSLIAMLQLKLNESNECGLNQKHCWVFIRSTYESLHHVTFLKVGVCDIEKKNLNIFEDFFDNDN